MLVGYIEPGPALAGFTDRIVRAPFQDFINLQRLIGSVEFNLMPLQANVFTDCKSELKYFEAAAVGTLSIASPSANYRRAVQHGSLGYIARAHEWERVLMQAMQDGERYTEIACRARDDALARYDWQLQRASIEEAIGWR